MQKVPDFEFVFHVLTSGPVHHVLRQCIMWPLVPFKAGQAPDWAYGFATLRRRWRDQIRALQILGWRPSRTHPWRLRNCCPTLCYVRPAPPKIEVCNMDTICPDCYARAKAPLVERVLDLLGNGETLRFFRQTEYVAFGLLDAHGIREKLKKAAAGLQRILRASGPAWSGKHFRPSLYSGAYWLVAVDPFQVKKDEDEPEYHWRFESRLLVSLPKENELAFVPEDWGSRDFPDPSIFDYNSALTSVLKYPSGLLRGPAAAVLKILNARKGLHLSGARGTFRGEGEKSGGDVGGV